MNEAKQIETTSIRCFIVDLGTYGLLSEEARDSMLAEVESIEGERTPVDAANRAFVLGLKVMAILRRFSLQGAKGKAEDPVWNLAREIRAANPQSKKQWVCSKAREEFQRRYKRECETDLISMEKHFAARMRVKATVKG